MSPSQVGAIAAALGVSGAFVGVLYVVTPKANRSGQARDEGWVIRRRAAAITLVTGLSPFYLAAIATPIPVVSLLFHQIGLIETSDLEYPLFVIKVIS